MKSRYTFGSPMPTRSWSDPNSMYKYGFNGKEKDNETTVDGGDYDFGARIYDSRLGRWLSLDPMMVKYSDLSPFVSMGNSPLLFMDFDGKVLKIQGDNGTYTYKNGKLYTEDGKKADISTDAYATSVLNEISKLTKTPTGEKAIEYLIEDEQTTTIMPLDNEHTENKCETKSKDGNGPVFIYFDPNSNVDIETTSGLVSSEPYTQLGHEMGHAISVLDGTWEGSKWFGTSNKDEIYASYIENLIRKEAQLSKRKYYGSYSEGGPIDESKLIDDQGKNLYPFKYAGIPENDTEKKGVGSLKTSGFILPANNSAIDKVEPISQTN